MMTTIMFTCPECKSNFEFDAVEQYEFVPCPICGTHYVTIKKGSKLILEVFEQTLMC